MRTGFLYDTRYLNHDTGYGHPECAERLSVTINYLQQQPWFQQLHAITPISADRKWLETVHSRDYIDHVEQSCREGLPYLDTPDVAICRESYDIALLAAGGAMQLADAVMNNEIDNGFGLIRPPGHHAEHAQALGFCLFNNIAIVARYLQQAHGLDKILILDWDVHHGNGTQHIFEADPSVFYISLHQHPFYPGSGRGTETGHDAGSGTTLNCPMPAGASDQEYRKAFKDYVIPAINDFHPQVILISAGFDAHRDDPLAGICLSSDIYRWMTQRVMECADHHSHGRIISLLEGGYDLHALPESIANHLSALSAYHIEPVYP